jgi:hypothetical protein
MMVPTCDRCTYDASFCWSAQHCSFCHLLLLLQASGAFKTSWEQLGDTAADLLKASSGVAYIGPALAILGYAIKQWSACQAVPQQAVDLLQSCRDLVADLNDAWPHIYSSSDTDKQQRLEGWLVRLAAAALGGIEAHARSAAIRCAAHHQVSTVFFCLHLQHLPSHDCSAALLQQPALLSFK